MSLIVDWTAVCGDGLTIPRAQGLSPSELPHDAVRRIDLVTDHPTMRGVRAVIRPGSGERIKFYNRRSMTAGTGAGVSFGSIPVVEITPDPARPEKKVRVFLHADGIVISTEDL